MSARTPAPDERDGCLPLPRRQPTSDASSYAIVRRACAGPDATFHSGCFEDGRRRRLPTLSTGLAYPRRSRVPVSCSPRYKAPLRRSPGGPRRSASRATRSYDESGPRITASALTAQPRCHLTPTRSRPSPLQARSATLANPRHRLPDRHLLTSELLQRKSVTNLHSKMPTRVPRRISTSTRPHEPDLHSALERLPRARQTISRRLDSSTAKRSSMRRTDFLMPLSGISRGLDDVRRDRRPPDARSIDKNTYARTV
jgi:hypothetical protein